MRVLFLSDNFPPEFNAPATRTHEHCREWVEEGADVTVITCAPNFPSGRTFPGYENRRVQREVIDGIRVVRVWTYMAPNAGFVRRIIDYTSFAVSSFLAGLWEDFDVIVATSPQFFTTFAGFGLSKVRRKPWVFEVRDLWPESIVATGVMKPGFVVTLLERIEMGLYRDACRVVVVTEAFRKNLVARGIDGAKIDIVTNGILPEHHTPRTERSRQDRNEFVVGYVGTHGLAHGLEVVLEAAQLLSEEAVRFLLVGDGAQKDWLRSEATRRNLRNVDFCDPVAKGEVPALLARLDVALVPLRKRDAFRTVIPSKIFESAAAGAPVLLGVEGEAQALVEKYGAGLCFEPENASSLVQVVRRLASEGDLYEAVREGCRRLAEDYDRRRLARQMLQVVGECV